MTRVRTDNVFGTLTDNPLTAGATTMNSAGLANLAVVSSAEAIIILDPNRLTGAPEHVVVTAHTGSATSATIVRGQFGTTARSHVLGTEWVHGPIASNASSFVTAADDQGDYVPMNAWESWTPTWTNLTVGNATQAAAFVRTGRTIHFRLRLTFGSTTTMGSDPHFSLPVSKAGAYDPTQPIAIADYQDTGTANFQGSGWAGSTAGTCRLVVYNVSSTFPTANIITSTVPHTWANTDVINVTGTYEAAS